jgi:tight adherence protein C
MGRIVAGGLRLPVDGPTARQVGRATGAAVVVLVVSPPAALAVVGLTWLRVARRHLRLRAEARRAVERSLPDAVDLFLLCTTGGMSLPLSHPAVARRLDGPVGRALVEADRRAAAGTPRGDALVAALQPLGDRAAALGRVLADHLRYGVPLGPSLDRLGLELRIDRRRRSEEAARKVPVRLLGPLVACTLPAFALLTVVPLLVASLQRLPT